MYSGGSLFLIAIGAILYFAVTAHVAGVDLHMMGFILMVIGAIAFVVSLIGAATTRHRLP